MSYILDALRRADAERERERGGVPGLHAQALPAPGLHAASARALPGWAWSAFGLGAGLVVALAGWLALRTPPVAAPTPTARAAAPAAGLSTTQAVASAAIASPPGTAVAPASAAAPPAPRAATLEAPPQRPAAAASTKRVAPAASASALPVLPFERLPDDVRRQLPRLAVDGSIYSEQHAQRILIIGGQLFHEGDAVAPGLVLERIEPKSAVFGWREWRYEVAY